MQLGTVPIPHSSVYRWALPISPSFLGWRPTRGGFGSWLTAQLPFFHSSVLQKAYIEQVAATGGCLFPHPKLWLCRKDLSGIVGEDSSLPSLHRIYCRRADPLGFTAEWQLPFSPASWNRRPILGRFSSQWISTDPNLSSSGLQKIYPAQWQQLNGSTWMVAQISHTCNTRRALGAQGWCGWDSQWTAASIPPTATAP